MIIYLNLLLRQLLGKPLDLRPEQMGFEPPDEAWRKYVSTDLKKPATNIYLVDLRENAGRRSNEWTRQSRNGDIAETPAPHWLDCHYLITAWDPADPNLSAGIEPTLVEHTLLYGVTATLIESNSLVPREVYEPDPLPAGFPSEVADVRLPINALPAEGFGKLAEFWGTMGTGYRWKPAVYLVVTVPVITEREVISTMVTTLMTRYRQAPDTEPEIVVTVGGNRSNP